MQWIILKYTTRKNAQPAQVGIFAVRSIVIRLKLHHHAGCISRESLVTADHPALAQGGIITRILASRMQRSLESRAKSSSELMQNDANSPKPMRQTRYFDQSICSKGLGCGEVKNFIPPCTSQGWAQRLHGGTPHVGGSPTQLQTR